MSVCESLLSMVLQSVENVLKKAETLKDQLMNIENIACDKDGMVCQQKLQRIYHDALIRDLEYSLDHKAEVDLWNHGFRNSIVTLQSLARDKKNPKRDESENKLTRFLESATAFYSALLHDVCAAFDLELPFRRNGRSYACPKKILPPKSVTKPNKNSCYYMCQYCLVHLGDLARYRHLGRQAELFYRYAVQLSPCSGHPYNQLALVEAARGDRLSTVFYYVRSVSVRHPFPAAALNLTKTLNQYVDEEIDVEGRVKLTVPECVTVFLRFHGLLSKLTDLEVAEKYVKLLTNTLTALVATESFSATQLVQMLAINLYALHQRRGCAFLNKSTVLSESGLEATELQAKRLVLHLVAGSLSAFLLPVYTLKDGEALLDYFALPAIKLTLDWIHLESSVLNEAAFVTRRQIWPSLCKLLNVIQPYVGNFSVEKWTFVPLPEDKALQCFIPLERLLNNYRFVFDEPKMETETTNKLRASRLVEFGVWLSEQENLKLLKTRKDSGENDKVVFELAYLMQPDMAQKEVITVQETKDDSLNTSTLTDIGSLDSDSTSGIGEGTETQSPPDLLPTSLPPPGMKDEELHKHKVPTVTKDNASVATLSSVQTQPPGPGIMKKYRQNVAMQAILKKMDQESIKTAESKQVTFKTPASAGSEAEKKTQNKQLKGSQDKQNSQQTTSKAISIAVHTSNDKNKSATTSGSTGKNLTFSIHGSQDNTQIPKEKQNAADKVHSPAVNFQDKNVAPVMKMGQDAVGGNAFLGGTPFHSTTPQDKSLTLPAQNSQKKSVTFTDEKILSFAAQVFQNRGLAYKGTFPSLVQQDKTNPLSAPAAPEKALPFTTQAVDNKTSTYPVANMKEKPISYSGIVQQETAKQPVTETSTWIFNKNVMPPPPPRDVRATVAPTTQTRTELPGTQIFGGVGSFSQELLKNPLFKLPDLQELRSTPDSNVSSPQMYSPGNALGTEIPKVSQSQYSMEINKSLGSAYTGPDAKTKPDFTNVSSVNNVDSSQLHIPAAIGSEHSAFQPPSTNFTHPHSTSRNFPDQMGKVRPPPGYTMPHVPQTPVSWWKEDLTPAPLTTWWKVDTASSNRPVSQPPGDDSTAIPYSPLGYGRPPSQQLPLNESAGKTDTGYGNHLWSMGSPSPAVDVNLHHKLVGGTGQQQASFTASNHQQPTYSGTSQQQTTYSRPDSSLTGMFTSDVNMPMFGPRDTTERGLPEVTTCGVGSYAPGSLFPMPTRHSGPGGDNTYSLFSSTQWATPSTSQASQQGMSFGGLMSATGSSGLGTQSLWSGPGPSPLERLLEQQKRLREGPASKKGT